jgi:hypothetical protein
MPRHWKIANPMLSGSSDESTESERAPLSDLQSHVPTSPAESMPPDVARMVAQHEQEWKQRNG